MQGRKGNIASTLREYFTNPRFLLLLYFATIAVLIAIVIPVILQSAAAEKDDHEDRAQQIADRLSDHVDEALTQWLSALELMRGFVYAAVPLTAPDYFTMNLTERAQVAMQSSNPGAFSSDAYTRLREMCRDMMGPTFRSVVVQPGSVGVFSTVFAPSDAWVDWFNRSPGTVAEHHYMVNNTQGIRRPPRFSTITPGVLVIVARDIIFNDTSMLDSDPTAFDPATGRHPNWKYVWGSIASVANLAGYRDGTGFAELEGIATHNYHFMLESNGGTYLNVDYDRTIITNTTSPGDFAQSNVRSCVQTQGMTEYLCFTVLPRDGWDGEGTVESQLLIAVILILAVPLAILGLIYLLLRMAAGNEQDPLVNLPRGPPFHAVCVDMVDANHLWAEAPYVMHDVGVVFDEALDELAARHKVFVGLRLGNTAIVVGSSRQRIVSFARDFDAWNGSNPWPGHVAVHCPTGTITLSFTLHTCENVTMQVDHTTATPTVDFGGDDVQLLLMMRVPAIPNHVICTHAFLSLPRPGTQQQGPNASMSDAPDTAARDIIETITGPVVRLGVCGLPLASATGATSLVEGFLLESAATADRHLDDVVDSFPDTIWAEWQTGKDLEGQDNLTYMTPNPLTASVTYAGASRAGAGASSTSKTRSMSVAQRRIVTSAHLNNLEASEWLRGSAVDQSEARRLAQVLAPQLPAQKRGKGSVPLERDGIDATPSHASSSEDPNRAQHVAMMRLCKALSLGTYFLTAFRIVFAPLDPQTRTSVVRKVCAAAGVGADDYAYALAARCTRMNLRYLGDDETAAASVQGDRDAMQYSSSSSSAGSPNARRRGGRRDDGNPALTDDDDGYEAVFMPLSAAVGLHNMPN